MKWPPKGDGVLPHTPIPQRLGLTEHNSELRALQLQQITARTLLEIRATLDEIRDLLRDQNRNRNGIDLTGNGWWRRS